jgi:hypothetical protein
MAGLSVKRWLWRVVRENVEAQSRDGKLASLAKGSSSGIYLLGTILGKPTHPEIE